MLTLDVGSSSVGVGRWTGDQVEVTTLAEPEQAARLLDGPAAVISVAPQRLQRLRDALPPGRARTLRLLEGTPLPLAHPDLGRSAGADRLANALALLPGPGVVVDAGTAVTVDLVDASGRYRGGFIAPGPAAAGAGLAARTERLPCLPGEPVQLVPGAHTEAAVAAGLWGLVVGGVDRLVDEALAALGADGPARLVATGGWARAWIRASRHPLVTLDPGHLHRGIARWAAGAQGAGTG